MTTWVWPVANVHITSAFSPARKHPVTGVVQAHQGADFRAPLGEPIRAVAAGEVTRALWGNVSGNYIRVQHADGIWSGYSHLSKRAVRVGDHVTTGQVIGLAGATGSATGPHLHFEIHAPGAVDPVAFLTARVGHTAAGGTSSPASHQASPAQEDDMTPEQDARLTHVVAQVNELRDLLALMLRAISPRSAAEQAWCEAQDTNTVNLRECRDMLGIQLGGVAPRSEAETTALGKLWGESAG